VYVCCVFCVCPYVRSLLLHSKNNFFHRVTLKPILRRFVFCVFWFFVCLIIYCDTRTRTHHTHAHLHTRLHNYTTAHAPNHTRARTQTHTRTDPHMRAQPHSHDRTHTYNRVYTTALSRHPHTTARTARNRMREPTEFKCITRLFVPMFVSLCVFVCCVFDL